MAGELRYGRSRLISLSEPLVSTDVPLQPGETYVFKLSEGNARGWEYLREKEGKAGPKFLELSFQVLNYGDGTGFVTTSAKPMDINKKINLLSLPNSNAPPIVRTRFNVFLPASFLSVNFCGDTPAIDMWQSSCDSGCQKLRPAVYMSENLRCGS